MDINRFGNKNSSLSWEAHNSDGASRMPGGAAGWQRMAASWVGRI